MTINAQEIFEELIRDYIAGGIPLKKENIYPLLQYSRSLTKLGSCMKKNKVYYIFLSVHAMESREQIRNTLAHELVHTLPGCMNHGKTFHKYGDMVKNRLGITVNSTASKEQAGEAGIQDAYLNRANYKIVCRNCGNEIYRLKRCNLVDHPSGYRCSKCGGAFQVYRLIRK